MPTEDIQHFLPASPTKALSSPSLFPNRKASSPAPRWPPTIATPEALASQGLQTQATYGNVHAILDSSSEHANSLYGNQSLDAGNGLTSLPSFRDQHAATDARDSITPVRSVYPLPHTLPPVAELLRHSGFLGKRPSDEETSGAEIHRVPSKKARTRIASAGGPKLGRVTSRLPHPPFHTEADRSITRLMDGRPTSLPFSSPEASAAMLARLREDPDSVTTVRLPRGDATEASLARSGSTPGSISSLDAAGASRSPDSRSLPPGLNALQGIGVIEFLEQDERPTFIIDLATSAASNRSGLQILYANASLRASQSILELLSPEMEDTAQNSEFTNFKTWATSSVNEQESISVSPPSMSYGGISWTCSTLRKRFRSVSGNSSVVSGTVGSPGPLARESDVLEQRSRGPTPSVASSTPMRQISMEPDYFGDVGQDIRTTSGIERPEDIERHHSDEFTRRVLQARPTKDSFDWTRIRLTPDLPEHILFARSIDWAATPLGPIEDWPLELRQTSNLVMGSPHAAAMYWGPELIAIYNKAYIDLAGKKHPKMMGSSYMDAWGEIWDGVEPIFRNALEFGQSTMKQDNRLFINREVVNEEVFFSWSIVPLVGADGSVVGLYNSAFENTRRRVSERLMYTLREIGERTHAARDVGSFWPQVQAGLEYNGFDVPFALIYAVKDDNTESEVSSMHSGSLIHPPEITLVGSLGVPSGHPAAVTDLDLRTSDEGFAPYMRESMTMVGQPVILSSTDGTLPSHLIAGLEWRGYGDPSTTIVVFPVHPTNVGDTVAGFIVLGLNPRRPYDKDYELFIHLLSRQLATSLASVVLFEEELKRSQRAVQLAALDKQELSLQLRLRTQQAVESEYRFARMAEFAPVGMFIADPHGTINYCNDMWWQISRHPRSEDSLGQWMESVRDEDRASLEAVWQRLVQEKVAVTHEFRFKGPPQNENRFVDTWVLMSAYPEKDETGLLKSIFGCITDITPQKGAEDFQKQRREEAVELKRQQENFIDITSHEMRNPLSAILQCADEINNSISDFQMYNNRAEYVATLLDSCTEAANTIILCASHQKRIVDDILTLSKLDSQLLLVTPVDVQPLQVVERALKMFESELNTNDIELDLQIEQPYVDYGVNWVKLDPSRLRQVLINLMTNAIKFTQNCEKRNISVKLGASRDISEATKAGITYIPTQRDDLSNMTDDEDWGCGEEINLHLAVQDSGPGLGEDEAKLLFQRFSQASPRTHVQYGGSGLGLFISRILTELQGGQIGVTSQKGSGSTFNFYIKCRKSENPPSQADAPPALSIPKIIKPEKPAASQSKTVERRPSIRKHAEGGPPPLDVLIVEDNLVNQKVLQKQLRIFGNNTHVANHGGEALETLRKSRFWTGQEANGVHISVILMDLEMPVMDGMTCARRIRELERDGVIVRHIPIIAVTAYARPEQIESAKAAGIDDVISKPFRIPELIPKIEELVSKYKTLTPPVRA